MRKLAALIRSELHINPRELTAEDFVERAREALWLVEFKQDKLISKLENSVVRLLKAVYSKD